MLFFAVSLGLKTTVYTVFPIFLSYTVSFIVFSVIESPLDFITQTRKEGEELLFLRYAVQFIFCFNASYPSTINLTFVMLFTRRNSFISSHNALGIIVPKLPFISFLRSLCFSSYFLRVMRLAVSSFRFIMPAPIHRRFHSRFLLRYGFAFRLSV